MVNNLFEGQTVTKNIEGQYLVSFLYISKKNSLLLALLLAVLFFSVYEGITPKGIFRLDGDKVGERFVAKLVLLPCNSPHVKHPELFEEYGVQLFEAIIFVEGLDVVRQPNLILLSRFLVNNTQYS